MRGQAGDAFNLQLTAVLGFLVCAAFHNDESAVVAIIIILVSRIAPVVCAVALARDKRWRFPFTLSILR